MNGGSVPYKFGRELDVVLFGRLFKAFHGFLLQVLQYTFILAAQIEVKTRLLRNCVDAGAAPHLPDVV